MKKIYRWLIVVAALAVVGIALVVSVFSYHLDNVSRVDIYLPPETTYEAVCDSLRAHRVIGSEPTAIVFDKMAQARGYKKVVKAGHYVVEPNMRVFSLVQKLYYGTQDPIRLTIKKYRTPESLNDFLNTQFAYSDYHFDTSDIHIVRPNTYQFYWTTSFEAFKKRMQKEYDRFFEKRMQELQRRVEDNEEVHPYLKNIPSTRDIVIVASIVEEETNNKEEKPIIASVYLNRLQRGTLLQADPTVKYAVGDFSLRRILNKHLAIDNPYNTYKYKGLPPSPICTPSDISIDAVLNAPATTYLFFCAKEDFSGKHNFASTLKEHSANAKRYHDALDKRSKAKKTSKKK